jgi:hypothetical protein
MKAKILKRVVHEGKKLQPGEIADISEWRNKGSLISGRYVEILVEQTEETKPSIAKSAPDDTKTPAKIKEIKSE